MGVETPGYYPKPHLRGVSFFGYRDATAIRHYGKQPGQKAYGANQNQPREGGVLGSSRRFQPAGTQRREIEWVYNLFMTYDLLLRGGRVIDPANGIDSTADVAITGGKIAAVGPRLAERSTQVIDARGLIVTPGLVDLHTHVYKFRPTPGSYIESINPDAHLFASGVTTAVDTGSTGPANFLDFKEHTIDKSRVRILAFVNIARLGMVEKESEQTLADLDPRAAADVARAFPEIVVGIKTAHYWVHDPFDELHPPWASVDRALEAAALCGLPLMADFWPRPPERPYPDLILEKLRPGDIHTHVFAQQFPVLNDEGKVSDFLYAARQRGVIFDVGHGAASFWFRQAVPAFRQGFVPDTISTDLHMANVNGPVISLQNTISKFLNMGMGLPEAVARTTTLPARVIHRHALGTLTPGLEADVAVFALREGQFAFTDCGNYRMAGRFKLECQMTVRAGEVVYDPEGRSMEAWDAASR